MRIDAIEIYRVAMPLIYPFRTAFGNDAVIESVLVRMSSDALVGWGEASPWQSPAYSPEYAAGMYDVIRRFLAPCLLGRETASGRQLQDMLKHVKGNYFAKAALDIAWWDLKSQQAGQPLWKALGGERRIVEVGADFGIMGSIDELLQAIQGAVDAGFRRVKLKYRPGWELDMLSAVRRAFPDAVFHVDCNSAYALSDLPMLRRLDDFNLAMIEQPLMHDDLLDHAELQRQVRTPICLDESISSPDRARKAASVKACGWVNIKPGRVGGLTPALEIHDICRDAGMPCWIGGMLESSVGASACLALATLGNVRYPSDIFPTSRFYKRDLGNPTMRLSGPSQMIAPSSAGLGAAPDPEQLAKHTIEHSAITPA